MDKPPQRKSTQDRGYPPQYSAQSEKEYVHRRHEAMEEHRDRRSVGPSSVATPSSDYERYDLRRRDDPKQVSNQYVDRYN